MSSRRRPVDQCTTRRRSGGLCRNRFDGRGHVRDRTAARCPKSPKVDVAADGIDLGRRHLVRWPSPRAVGRARSATWSFPRPRLLNSGGRVIGRRTFLAGIAADCRRCVRRDRCAVVRPPPHRRARRQLRRRHGLFGGLSRTPWTTEHVEPTWRPSPTSSDAPLCSWSAARSTACRRRPPLAAEHGLSVWFEPAPSTPRPPMRSNSSHRGRSRRGPAHRPRRRRDVARRRAHTVPRRSRARRRLLGAGRQPRDARTSTALGRDSTPSSATPCGRPARLPRPDHLLLGHVGGRRWSHFDLVGVDLYRDALTRRHIGRTYGPASPRQAGCHHRVRLLLLCRRRRSRRRRLHDRRLVRTEPVRTGNPVRDEQVQADYLDDLLDIFETERVHGAFVWNFIEPDSPYSPDPRHDLDMAGFAIVRCDADYTTGRWTPKQASTPSPNVSRRSTRGSDRSCRLMDRGCGTASRTTTIEHLDVLRMVDNYVNVCRTRMSGSGFVGVG